MTSRIHNGSMRRRPVVQFKVLVRALSRLENVRDDSDETAATFRSSHNVLGGSRLRFGSGLFGKKLPRVDIARAGFLRGLGWGFQGFPQSCLGSAAQLNRVSWSGLGSGFRGLCAHIGRLRCGLWLRHAVYFESVPCSG